MRQLFSETLFPVLILRIGSITSLLDSALALAVVKLLFILFSNSPSLQNRSAFLQVMLTPLCTAMNHFRLDDAFISFCGGAITEIAQSNAELFKSEVLILSDDNRLTLQNAMRSSMVRKVDNGSAALSPVGNNLSDVKRIDLSRYQKR